MDKKEKSFAVSALFELLSALVTDSKVGSSSTKCLITVKTRQKD